MRSQFPVEIATARSFVIVRAADEQRSAEHLIKNWCIESSNQPLTSQVSYDGSRFKMSTLDWSHCPAVESIPGKVSGAWVFRGTRVPVSAIFENLKCSSLDEVLENFPVSREQVLAVLDFAAKSAGTPRAA